MLGPGRDNLEVRISRPDREVGLIFVVLRRISVYLSSRVPTGAKI
jgi:hypothetical protein